MCYLEKLACVGLSNNDNVSDSSNSCVVDFLVEEHAYLTSPVPLYSRLSLEQAKTLLYMCKDSTYGYSRSKRVGGWQWCKVTLQNVQPIVKYLCIHFPYSLLSSYGNATSASQAQHSGSKNWFDGTNEERM